jgi:hypothetical protein
MAWLRCYALTWNSTPWRAPLGAVTVTVRPVGVLAWNSCPADTPSA